MDDIVDAAGTFESTGTHLPHTPARFATRVNTDVADSCSWANHVTGGLVEGEGTWEELLERGGCDKKMLKASRESMPLRRFGAPDDIAEAAAFLMSDAPGGSPATRSSRTAGSPHEWQRRILAARHRREPRTRVTTTGRPCTTRRMLGESPGRAVVFGRAGLSFCAGHDLKQVHDNETYA
ncbi:hypothetical protein LWP59_05770 [Amycolatopsis acidiphila]|uniref:SDR family oxidoreductase n=1 Tax=Amycolatopsis acidiphila TaxID=715473 RepID=A0A558AHW7_9PSEU|nr:hypothetical protein [Amycolatopsis acidiphila]TVT23872.1 hypothetical protein FNH06_08380 [Amycolatopsis acidiphila]UIJ61152.1 hypothetical protein LWP59_05770 [Amycolatopsis acidiphila]